MTNYATSDGTRRYAARFAATSAAGAYREPVGCATPERGAPLLSSIGIGTYLGQPDETTDRAYTEPVIAAVEGGINVIDSAINYRFQRSERSIGAALVELTRRGFSREELALCTKGGYLTPDGAAPEGVAAHFYREYFELGILRFEEVAGGCHAIAPAFLSNQLSRSLANLGVDCVDVYYLHNPETQLGDVAREELDRRLRAAFEFLESAVVSGRIRFYGMATWSGLRQPEDAADYLSLAAIEQIAREVAGAMHRFRFVQVPYNLGMTEALTRANQPVHGPGVPLIEAAEALGITLVASASLMQGKLTEDLPAFIGEALGLRSDAERALQFVRSSPGIATALVGMSRVEHVKASLRLLSEPTATSEQFASLFARGRKS